jgi:hypothetical protein
MYTYIVLDTNTIHRAGLNHMKDRLADFLKLSKVLGLIPVLPTLYLTDEHTLIKDCILHNYLEIPDYVQLSLSPEIRLDQIFVWKLTDEYMIRDRLFCEHKDAIIKIPLSLEYLHRFKIIAKRIVDTMIRPICIVHVRRSDYLNIHSSLFETTTCSAIEKVLHKYQFNTCYIMTSEPDPNYFNSLKEKYTMYLASDIQELKEYSDKGDNYAIYAIECCMRDLCDVRISTFNTKESEPWYLPKMDVDYFNASLDEHQGYQ